MRATLSAVGVCAGLVVSTAVFPTEAAAQAPVRSESPWAIDAAPTAWESAAHGSDALARTRAVPPIVVQKDKETGLTLIIVGGAMFVGGLVIGDTGGTLLAVGGVGVGAYGLYLYMD